MCLLYWPLLMVKLVLYLPCLAINFLVIKVTNIWLAPLGRKFGREDDGLTLSSTFITAPVLGCIVTSISALVVGASPEYSIIQLGALGAFLGAGLNLLNWAVLGDKSYSDFNY